MLRFPCPACDKTIKVEESFVGKKVRCPRCNEPTRVPSPSPQVEALEPAPSLFASMSPGLRLTAAGVAMTGGVSLLAAVLVPLLGEAGGVTRLGLFVAGCSFLVLLTMVYGHGTSCPCCKAWWSRNEVKSEVGDREVFERDGASFGRTLIRTEFKCRGCDHTWSVTDAEEYPLSERSKERKPRG